MIRDRATRPRLSTNSKQNATHALKTHRLEREWEREERDRRLTWLADSLISAAQQPVQYNPAADYDCTVRTLELRTSPNVASLEQDNEVTGDDKMNCRQPDIILNDVPLLATRLPLSTCGQRLNCSKPTDDLFAGWQRKLHEAVTVKSVIYFTARLNNKTHHFLH